MRTTVFRKHYDVVIIGAGATGAGTARDCAMRGLSVLLVERYDFASGATGRNHGLLHSGARYAVTDEESARECISENTILRKIARHCVEDTGGLFITLSEDDLSYQRKFIEACLQADIPAVEIDPVEARRMEPAVNPELIGAVTVPDGAIDPFRLTTANVISARSYGADILTYHEVTGLLKSGSRVEGVELYDRRNNTVLKVAASLVINAGGVWSQRICRMAGIDIKMFPSKGVILVFGHRINNVVINRCRKPGDADILVPGDTISLIGTTSSCIPFEEVDSMGVTRDEVDTLLREGMKIAPGLAYTRILRAYAGVRPLIANDDDSSSGRSISRGIMCIDHAACNGVEGMITISGGKLMTYRLMAEKATDMACLKLGMSGRQCETAIKPLPGSDSDRRLSNDNVRSKRHVIELSAGQKAALGRHGSRSREITLTADGNEAKVCECELVSVGEIKYAIDKLHAESLAHLRRRTRLGMGTCQGCLCACRAAAILGTETNNIEAALEDLEGFINERWKGMMPVAWGKTLVEAQFTSWLYAGIGGLRGSEKHNDCVPIGLKMKIETNEV